MSHMKGYDEWKLAHPPGWDEPDEVRECPECRRSHDGDDELCDACEAQATALEEQEAALDEIADQFMADMEKWNAEQEALSAVDGLSPMQRVEKNSAGKPNRFRHITKEED